MRRPQKSELMRSASCQSGPVSSTTTFLPALASVAANTEPEAPAPTMTTSTFSRVAMSPPLQRRDMRLVWNAERFVALDRAVHHVDRIAAHHEVDETLSRSLPSLQLSLSHEVHHFALRRYGQPGKALIGLRRGGLVERTERGPVEVRVRRAHVEDARFEQRLLGRQRDLVIDEVCDARGARPGHQRFAERFQGFRLAGLQEQERHYLGPGPARCRTDLRHAR